MVLIILLAEAVYLVTKIGRLRFFQGGFVFDLSQCFRLVMSFLVWCRLYPLVFVCWMCLEMQF